jgi:hypothetical protein
MTPLSALFQIFTLLKVIAQTEMARTDGRWQDEDRQTVDWNGTTIHRSQLCEPYDSLINDIQEGFRRDVFFGKPIPEHLSADFFKNKNINDPISNRSIGFCALDYPPNGFRELQGHYLEWLYDQEDLRQKFTYEVNGTVHWRQVPVTHLMQAIDRLTLNIAADGSVLVGFSHTVRDLSASLFLGRREFIQHRTQTTTDSVVGGPPPLVVALYFMARGVRPFDPSH